MKIINLLKEVNNVVNWLEIKYTTQNKFVSWYANRVIEHGGLFRFVVSAGIGTGSIFYFLEQSVRFTLVMT